MLYLQDPFDNVDDRFYKKIARPDMEKLRTFLSHTNVELFQGQLYECIMLQLTIKMDRNAEDYVDYSDWRLVDVTKQNINC